MAGELHFECPGCGVLLRVPAAASGTTGPCPRCGWLISAPKSPREPAAARLPVPATGAPPARLPASPPDPVPLPSTATTVPFSTRPGPAAYPQEPPPARKPAEPLPPHREQVPQSSDPPLRVDSLPHVIPSAGQTETVAPASDAWWFFVCLALAMITLAAGFAAGRFTAWLPALAPGPSTQVPPPADESPRQPPAADLPKHPSPDEAPSASFAEEPEAVLRKFLESPDWKARSRFVLDADHVRPLMEAHYRKHPDGPVPVLSISLDHAENDNHHRRMLFLFRLATEDMPDGFPVVVVETPDGWKVDWESYVEFRDDLFAKFAADSNRLTGQFRLIVREKAGPSAVIVQGGQSLTAYRVDPPLPGRGQEAWVVTDSDVHRRIAAAVSNGRPFTPVLDLSKRPLANGATCLEITGIPATDWRPRAAP